MANSSLHDADLEIRAQLSLSASPIFAIRELQVRRENNELVLRGRVPTFYFKQVAQELVRAVSSGYPVVNRVEVD
jgi:osmotically-inducible protein OsmY